MVSFLVLTPAAKAQCPAGDWRVPTTQPPLSDWSQIAFGNGRFVAISSGSSGADAYVAYSTDGMVWTQSATSIPDNEWRWITYGNGLFVAVGWHGSRRIMTSPDGNTWTMVNSTLTNNGSWQSVAYGKGRFVAVANNGTNRIITSDNGTNWTARTAPTGDYSTVAYGGGRFVVLSFSGSGTTALYSSDGIAWNSTTMPNGSWLDVVYGNGQFVAVSWTGNHIATSPDGIVWTARSVPDSRSWGAITYTGGHYVVVGAGGSGPNRMMVSSDGITWEPKPIPHDGQSLSTATWGNNILLVTGHDLYPGQSQFFVGDCPERCYMPDGKRGAREWFASVNLYKFCDGERWRDFANDGTAGGCSVPGQMEWNEPQAVHTICDGAQRTALRHAHVDLGACVKKAAIDFDPAAPLYKYCDGDRWRPMTCVAAEGSAECPYMFNSIYMGNMGATMDWTHKWDGSVLADNSKIYSIPRDAANILVVDTNDTTESPYGTATLTTMGATISGSSAKWAGGALGANGKIYGIPDNSNSVLVIDPSDPAGGAHGTVSLTAMGASLSGGFKWYGGVRADNDKIYGIPASSTTVLVIDPSDPTGGAHGTATRTAMGASLNGSGKWCGGVLAANGKIYGMPYDATDILVIDPSDLTGGAHGTATRTSMGAVFPATDGKHCGAVEAANGKLYSFPFEGNQILIIDPSDLTGGPHGTATLSSLGASFSGAWKWIGSVKGPDGKLYGVPDNSHDIIAIDTEDLTAGPHGTARIYHGLPHGGWGGAHVAANNHLYMTPMWINTVLVMDFSKGECEPAIGRNCGLVPDACAAMPFQAVTNMAATNTEIRRSGTLQNATDGPRFTLSLWFKMKPHASNPTSQVLFENTSGRIQLGFYSDHPGDPIYDIWVHGKNGSDTYRAEIQAYDIISEDVWYHAIASVDTTLGQGRLYINDTEVSYDRRNIASGSQVMDIQSSQHMIHFFGWPGGFEGEIADFWYDDSYVDLSVEANRRKFISGSGKPASLGTDGSVPTGAQPLIFFSGDASQWGTNKGRGGTFTQTGTLKNASVLSGEIAGSPGVVCLDGTVYAGLSPDGNVPMFTTREDNELSGPPNMTWGSYGTLRGVTDGNTGQANTSTLAGFGAAAHPVAHYCDSISVHGHSDWYLPARYELHEMMQNAAAIGNFMDEGYSWYWSSTELDWNNDDLHAHVNRPTLNVGAYTGKSDVYPRSRCVRKGS